MRLVRCARGPAVVQKCWGGVYEEEEAVFLFRRPPTGSRGDIGPALQGLGPPEEFVAGA